MSSLKFVLISYVAVVGIFSARVWGQAGPPVIGDDPGTPGNGHWEINIAYDYLRTRSQTTMDTPQLDLNYGLGDHIELSYLGGWLLGDEQGQHWQDGIDNSQLGLKWRFLDQETSGVDMSIYPQLTFNTSRALTRTGLVDSGVGFFLPFEIAKTIGKWELDFEGGYQYLQHGRDQWAGGPVIGYLLNDRVELLFEGRGVFDKSFVSNDLILDAGMRVTIVPDHVQFLFAAGRGLRDNDDSPHLYLYTGMGFTF